MRFSRLVALVATVVIFIATGPARSQDRVSEPFLGIRHIQRLVAEPRPMFINALEIDLSAPGLSFRLTPPVPELPHGDETITQTTRDFVAEQGAGRIVLVSFDGNTFSWLSDVQDPQALAFTQY